MFDRGEGMSNDQWLYLHYRYSGGKHLTFDEWKKERLTKKEESVSANLERMMKGDKDD